MPVYRSKRKNVRQCMKGKIPRDRSSHYKFDFVPHLCVVPQLGQIVLSDNLANFFTAASALVFISTTNYEGGSCFKCEYWNGTNGTCKFLPFRHSAIEPALAKFRVYFSLK